MCDAEIRSDTRKANEEFKNPNRIIRDIKKFFRIKGTSTKPFLRATWNRTLWGAMIVYVLRSNGK